MKYRFQLFFSKCPSFTILVVSSFLNLSEFSSETRFLYFIFKEALKNLFYGVTLISFIVFNSNRDRCRTMVNVLGDAYGAGVVQHLSKADLAAASTTRDEELEMNQRNDITVDDKHYYS